jgi:hypothetical protein
MSVIHPVFLRTVSKDKAIVVAVLPLKILGTEGLADDSFVIAQTSNNIYTGCRAAIMFKSGIVPSTQFIDDINKAHGGESVEHTRGMSIGGVLHTGVWSIQETESVEDILGG